MRRIVLFLLIIILTTRQASAQFDSIFLRSRIHTCADSFAMGYITHNWDLYTRFTYPVLIASYGGLDSFARYIRAAAPADTDTTLKKFEPGKVLQLVKTARSYQAVLEFITVTETQGYRFTKTNALVAESWDGGFFWTFFDPRGDPNLAKMIDPEIDPSLQFPAEKTKSEKTALPPSRKRLQPSASKPKKVKT